MADQQEGCDFKLEKLPDPGSGGCKGDGGGHCEEGGGGEGGGSGTGDGDSISAEQVIKYIGIAQAVGSSAHNDFKQGTTRNVITTTTTIGGGLLGAEGGKFLGAAAGAFFGPAGVIAGSALGFFAGGYVSRLGATYAVDFVGDKLQYNMESRRCVACYRQFMARVYLNERRCQRCRQ